MVLSKKSMTLYPVSVWLQFSLIWINVQDKICRWYWGRCCSSKLLSTIFSCCTYPYNHILQLEKYCSGIPSVYRDHRVSAPSLSHVMWSCFEASSSWIEELFPREQLGPHCTSLHTQHFVEHLAREPALVFCAKLYIQEVYLGHPFLVSPQFRSRQAQHYSQCTGC